MSHFSELADRTRDIAGSHGFHPAAGDPALIDAVKSMPSGQLQMRTRVLRGDSHGEVRIATIQSPKIDIVSAFYYPPAHLALPVYAMEFVVLGTRPIVCVLDLVGPAGDPCNLYAADCLTVAHAETPTLTNANDAPDWFAESRSGHDFFIRPDSMEAVQEMAQVHLRLWSNMMVAVAGADVRPAAAAMRFAEFLAEYKDHHKRHSPGLPLMTRSFGADWTQRYLDDCFFA